MTVLDSLFTPGHELCVLAGSGISVDPPSSQPTGLAFTTALLSSLLPDELRERIPRLIDMEAGGSFLRFEQLMAYVQLLDAGLRVLDGLGLCDRPNPNHIALAELIKCGHAVFTTNFDSLIEHGLVRIGSPLTAVRPIIWRDDWESSLHPDERPVFKLHGSIVDMRDAKDTRNSLQTTLRQIGRAKDHAVSLESWKRGRLESALQASDLVVVGYSGLDDFDVVPALRSIPSTRKLIWIDHDHPRCLRDATLDVIDARCEVDASDRLDGILRALARAARADSAVTRVRVNTGEFLHWLIDRLGVTRSPALANEDNVPHEPRAKPSFDLGEAQRWYVAAEIHSYQDSRDAMDMVGRALEIAARDSDQGLMAQCENLLGRQCEALHYRADTRRDGLAWWHQAVDHYTRSLQLAERGGDDDDLDRQARALGNIGSMYLALKGTAGARKARACFERALARLGRREDPETQAWMHNQLGAAAKLLGELDAAIVHFRHACELDRAVGDLERLGVHLANLGSSLCEQGDDAGFDALLEAVELEAALGHKTALANCLNHLGLACASRGRQEEARAHYERAMANAAEAPPDLRLKIRRSLLSLQPDPKHP